MLRSHQTSTGDKMKQNEDYVLLDSSSDGLRPYNVVHYSYEGSHVPTC